MSCSVDFDDVLLAAAELYGGPAFVQEVVAEADAAAEAACSWHGAGDETLERHSVWLAAAWQLVDARRAELVGQLIPTVDGRWVEVTPARCSQDDWTSHLSWLRLVGQISRPTDDASE